MLQLIIGITLGIILLFVIMLLITEMASTYPVWKNFEKQAIAPPACHFPEKKEKSRSYLQPLLVVLLCIAGFGAAVYLVVNYQSSAGLAFTEKPESTDAPGTVQVSQPVASPERRLTDISTMYGLLINLQTKWADGKIYGNCRVAFEKAPVLNITDWRFALLDKDEFLIRELHFTANDFVFETDTSGQVTGLLNRFNAEMNQKDYQRIDRLQVVVDKKLGRR